MIRIAIEKDISQIQNFIHINWKRDHILAKSRDFFYYEHVYQGVVNFIISVNEKDEIDGILGYIPYGKKHRDIMTVMWMTKSKNNPFLGVEMLQYLEKACDLRTIASVGINKKTKEIYEYLGYRTGQLEHYYRLGQRKEYKIAKIYDNTILNGKRDEPYELVEINNFVELEKKYNLEKKVIGPYKESWYIKKRYFGHPIYSYRIFGIGKNGFEAVLFGREINIDHTKIFRIVDFLGDEKVFTHIVKAFDEIIEKNDYEYIDFYQYGIDEKILKDAGFIKKETGKNIIPNYFEPFERKNIEIYFFTSDRENIRFFKGDCDQDRPNYYRRRKNEKN